DLGMHAGRDVEHAVELPGVDDGGVGRSAEDGQIVAQIEVAGGALVFTGAGQREGVGAGGEQDDVRTVVGVGGEDRLAQGAVGVAGAIGRVVGAGDGVDGGSDRGGHGESHEGGAEREGPTGATDHGGISFASLRNVSSRGLNRFNLLNLRRCILYGPARAAVHPAGQNRLDCAFDRTSAEPTEPCDPINAVSPLSSPSAWRSPWFSPWRPSW